MLCEHCIQFLSAELSREAVCVLSTLVGRDRPLNQRQIIESTGLSVSVVRDALRELKGAMLIASAPKGRSVIYSPTRYGEKAITYHR